VITKNTHPREHQAL
jgi:hypothetical protein